MEFSIKTECKACKEIKLCNTFINKVHNKLVMICELCWERLIKNFPFCENCEVRPCICVAEFIEEIVIESRPISSKDFV